MSKKKWHVSATVVGSKYLGEFEADTAEEAIELAGASDAAWVNLCHQCAEECEDPQIDHIAAHPVEIVK